MKKNPDNNLNLEWKLLCKKESGKKLKVNSTNLVKNLKRILFTSCHLNLLPDQKKVFSFIMFYVLNAEPKKTQNTIKFNETLPIRWSNKKTKNFFWPKIQSFWLENSFFEKILNFQIMQGLLSHYTDHK